MIQVLILLLIELSDFAQVILIVATSPATWTNQIQANHMEMETLLISIVVGDVLNGALRLIANLNEASASAAQVAAGDGSR